MSNVEETKVVRVRKTNTIMLYGSGNEKLDVPTAPDTIVNKFSIVASEYMTVPTEFFNDVVSFLTERGYVYKVAHETGYSIFALRFVKVSL